MTKPQVELTDVSISGNIATATVNIKFRDTGKMFDSFGALTYVLTDPEFINASVKDVEPVLRGFVLAMLNDVI